MVEDLGACDGVEIVLGGEIEKLCVGRPDCHSVLPARPGRVHMVTTAWVVAANQRPPNMCGDWTGRLMGEAQGRCGTVPALDGHGRPAVLEVAVAEVGIVKPCSHGP
jgi:hypothetical protein